MELYPTIVAEAGNRRMCIEECSVFMKGWIGCFYVDWCILMISMLLFGVRLYCSTVLGWAALCTVGAV